MLIDHRNKEAWLREQAGDITIAESEGQFIATLNGVFNKRSLVSAQQKESGKITLCKRAVLLQPSGIATDRLVSIDDLYQQIRQAALSGSLRLYWPKAGQKIADIQIGAVYKLIKNDDPEHDHTNKGIFDFVRLAIDARGERLIGLPYKKHIHYMRDEAVESIPILGNE